MKVHVWIPHGKIADAYVWFSLNHYANMPVQYTAIFHGCINDNFQIIFFLNFFLFLLKDRLWVHVRTASVRRF